MSNFNVIDLRVLVSSGRCLPVSVVTYLTTSAADQRVLITHAGAAPSCREDASKRRDAAVRMGKG